MRQSVSITVFPGHPKTDSFHNIYRLFDELKSHWKFVSIIIAVSTIDMVIHI